MYVSTIDTPSGNTVPHQPRLIALTVNLKAILERDTCDLEEYPPAAINRARQIRDRYSVSKLSAASSPC